MLFPNRTVVFSCVTFTEANGNFVGEIIALCYNLQALSVLIIIIYYYLLLDTNILGQYTHTEDL